MFWLWRPTGRDQGAHTLVMAGRDDFQFSPEHQAELAAGIANARLEIIERAGYNVPSERPEQVIEAVKRCMATANVPEGRPTTADADPTGRRRCRGEMFAALGPDEANQPERPYSPGARV